MARAFHASASSEATVREEGDIIFRGEETYPIMTSASACEYVIVTYYVMSESILQCP